jgi:hypothetical protein
MRSTSMAAHSLEAIPEEYQFDKVRIDRLIV